MKKPKQQALEYFERLISSTKLEICLQLFFFRNQPLNSNQLLKGLAACRVGTFEGRKNSKNYKYLFFLVFFLLLLFYLYSCKNEAGELQTSAAVVMLFDS